MNIKTLTLERLEADLGGVLNECAANDETIVVELPNHRLVSIQPLEPSEDDALVDTLIETNSEFRAIIEKSKASGYSPFPFRPMP